MSSILHDDPLSRLRGRVPLPISPSLPLFVASGLGGALVAYLVQGGLWYVAVVAVIVLPFFVLLHRAPLAGVVVWLVVAPFLLQTGGAVRYGFWAIHRLMPLAVLLVFALSRMLGLRAGRLPRLGRAELMMVGYVVVTLVSIGYTSDSPGTSVINLYDRVVVPMLFYIAIRLMQPSSDALRRLVPVAAFVIVTQGIIGALSWTAPELLPQDWLGRAGSRTIGSLSSPSVYGVTLLAAGGLALHAAAFETHRFRRIMLRSLFAISLVLMVVTFTRAVWIAALAGVVVLVVVHRREMRPVALAGIPIVIVLLLTGTIQRQVVTIQDRFGTEDTALQRLPLADAALQMVEERPIAGFGFGNFDKFDREFQREVAGYLPEKDRASHNLYLTLLAEQGVVGAGLYIGPAIWWFFRSVAAYPRLSRSSFASRTLLVILWTVLAGHVVVNNFSNMRVVYGLGQWWLILGLIAVIVSSHGELDRDAGSNPNAHGRSLAIDAIEARAGRSS
jgi:O-antigen ligase